jgi:hypothetical protein
MEQELKAHLKKLMASGDVAGIIALKSERGMAKPYLFADASELECLCLTPKYPMASVARLLLDEDGAARLPSCAEAATSAHSGSLQSATR